MTQRTEQIQESVAFIRGGADRRAQVGLVLGSGLGPVADRVTSPAVIPYAQIPHFPSTTVEGHAGQLLLGYLGGVPVACLCGRVHCYEGHSVDRIRYPIEVLAALGASAFVLTCAAGGIRNDLVSGDLMRFTSHIDFLVRDPLDVMAEIEHTDSSGYYDAELSGLAATAAAARGTELKRGRYAAVPGPNFETRTEVRLLAALGADAVGMSVVPEAVAAHEAGARVCALAVIANKAAGLAEGKLSHEEIVAAARGIEGKLSPFLQELIGRIGASSSQSVTKPMTRTMAGKCELPLGA